MKKIVSIFCLLFGADSFADDSDKVADLLTSHYEYLNERDYEAATLQLHPGLDRQAIGTTYVKLLANLRFKTSSVNVVAEDTPFIIASITQNVFRDNEVVIESALSYFVLKAEDDMLWIVNSVPVPMEVR